MLGKGGHLVSGFQQMIGVCVSVCLSVCVCVCVAGVDTNMQRIARVW